MKKKWHEDSISRLSSIFLSLSVFRQDARWSGKKKEKNTRREEEEERKKREDEEEKLPEGIENEIKSVLKHDRLKREGEIRVLEKKISALHSAKMKDKLLYELKSVSCCALSDDLRTMMEENGLALEGLTLVMKYLTTVPELAQFLYLNSTEVLDGEGLGIVKRRLGPSLEVLGGLTSRGIDVRKQWVKRLTEKAPSLHSLSRLSEEELELVCHPSKKGGKSDASGEEASKGEMDEVRRLAKVAKDYNRETSAVPPDVKLPDEKTINKEKLEEAKNLMEDAKKKASQEEDEAKTATKEKMEEMMKLLELPSDWNKQDIASPDQMLKELDGIIEQYSNVLEAAESYKSDLEVVAKASGGRALCGIYYSKYEPPRTAWRQILLMPANISLSNPIDAMTLDYLKFSESRAAAKYVHTVKSSSTSIGFSVVGFYEGFVGELKGAYSSEDENDNTRSVKSHSTSASAVQVIWVAKKCFQIEEEEMKLSGSALRKARAIVNDDDALRFMEMFGSHIPAGAQTLGGVLFNVADVESEETQTVTTLTNAATRKLQGQLSGGFIGGAGGIGGSLKGEHQWNSGRKEAEQEEDKKNTYSLTVHSIGPAATNPIIFEKMLAYNSTWALIDRGPHQAYIPVWEVLTDLGTDYVEAAEVLQRTWRKGESKLEKHWKTLTPLLKLRDEYEKRASILCHFMFIAMIIKRIMYQELGRHLAKLYGPEGFNHSWFDRENDKRNCSHEHYALC